MWSKKGSPVATSMMPVPSRSTRTSMAVSAVARRVEAVRWGGRSVVVLM